MTDQNNENVTTHPAATPPRPRIVARSESDHAAGSPSPVDVVDYFAFEASDRLKFLKDKITERERVMFDIELTILQLDGNPETGVHRNNVPGEQAFCPCGTCELKRAQELFIQFQYGVNQLRALYKKML